MRQVCYRVAIPGERAGELGARIRALLASETCPIERTRPEPRRLDVRPYIAAIRWLDGQLEMDLRVTPNGTARPQEILALLGLGSVLEEGPIFTRVSLELEEAPPPNPVEIGAASGSEGG